MTDLKNVITINDFNFAQGGASKVAIDTANGIAKIGLSSIFISVVADNEKCTLDSSVIQYTFGGQEFLQYKNTVKGMVNGLSFKEFGEYVFKVLSLYSPDDSVVHIHGWTKACSSIVFKICKNLGFSTYLTCHDYFTVCPNGALLNYRTNNCCNLKCCSSECLRTNCDSRNMLFKLYRFLREKKYYNDIDLKYVRCIFVSGLQKKLIEDQRVIGISTIIKSPIEELNAETSTIEKEYDFVYIGRDSREKGIDLFVELASRMRNYRFLIVGDYKREKTDNIDVTGWVNEYAVESYLKKSRVFVLPSLLPEPLSLVAIKALALGIPCLISENTGAAEHVNVNNGIIFKQGDLDDLVNKAPLALSIQSVRDDRLFVSNEDYIDNIVAFYKGKGACYEN